MRTALNRARRLVTLLLLALSAWYLFLRRRVPATGRPAVGPVGAGEPGAPGVLPDDVLATDAGLTELPDATGETPAVEPPGGVVVVDEILVGELLAEGPDGSLELVEVVEETVTVAELSALSTTTDTPDPTAVPDPAAGSDLADVGAVAGSAESGTGSDLADPADVGAGSDLVDPAAAPDLADAAAGADPAGSGDVPESVRLVAAVADGEVGGDGAVAPVLGAGAAGDEPTEQFAPGIEDGIEDPTNEIPRPTFAETPSPAFSEAPTMEMPVLMDDLRAVRGIGPSMERMLHGLGIVSFRQLALLDGSELERVRDELRDFRGRIDREDWIGQARQLHKTKYGTDPS